MLTVDIGHTHSCAIFRGSDGTQSSTVRRDNRTILFYLSIGNVNIFFIKKKIVCCKSTLLLKTIFVKICSLGSLAPFSGTWENGVCLKINPQQQYCGMEVACSRFLKDGWITFILSSSDPVIRYTNYKI